MIITPILGVFNLSVMAISNIEMAALSIGFMFGLIVGLLICKILNNEQDR